MVARYDLIILSAKPAYEGPDYEEDESAPESNGCDEAYG
jgi:hypothetical protein